MNMRKFALVICIHDGIGTHYCGVGTVARKTIESLEILKNQNLLNDFEIHFITYWFDHDAPYFNEAYFKRVRRLVASTGGRIHEVKLLKDGAKPKNINDNWGYRKWYSGSRKAAKIILSLRNEQIIFATHDISFGLTCHFLPYRKNISGYFIPHSTGLLFRESIRLPVDKKIFQAVVDKGYKVGYINDFMKKHIVRDYHLPPGVFVPIKNALVFHQNRGTTETVGLKRYHINTSNKIIFSYGRCGSQKAFDVLIKAFRKSDAYKGNYQLVILAPTDIADVSYEKYFSKLVKSIPEDKCVWIKKFVNPIPFLQARNLDTVVLSSRFECAPFTPLEICAYAPKAKILYSNIESFIEALRGLKGTRKVADFRINSWKNALNRTIASKNPIRKVSLESYKDNLLTLLRYAQARI